MGFEAESWLVLHLMIAGRLHWNPAGLAENRTERGSPDEQRAKAKPAKLANKQAVFTFDNGTLILTEAGTKRRASLHIVQGVAALRDLNPGGLEVLSSTLEEFTKVLMSQNHTLKRALTDPRLFSGIGNSYSDEILHRAKLSPVALAMRLSKEQIERLHRATKEILMEWTARLRAETGSHFPEKVTAFRPEMAVHGKYGQPCPVCNSKVQRIRYADNETNYCPGCQTGGKLLADRSLSLLLKRDWPKTLEELEEMRASARVG
jgi:formamidopyrimidine-DNA glycosylase